MSTEDRAAYIKGLRALADALEEHPDAPLPVGVTWHQFGSQAEQVAAIVGAVPAGWTGSAKGDGEYDQYELTGNLSGLPVRVATWNGAIATRRVTGKRVIETVEWDPHAIVAAALAAHTSPAPQEVEPALTGNDLVCGAHRTGTAPRSVLTCARRSGHAGGHKSLSGDRWNDPAAVTAGGAS